MFRRQSQFSNVLSYFRAGYGFQDDEFCFGLKNTINDRKFHSFSIFTGSLNITDEVIDDLDPDLLSKRGYVCEAGNDWVCPDGHLKIQDRCYGFVMQNATYIEAEQSCQSIYHGHLARMSTFFHVSIFIIHLKLSYCPAHPFYYKKALAVGIYGQRLNMTSQFWIQDRFDRNNSVLDFDTEETESCFEENIDYPGADVDTDPKYSSSPEECQQFCQANNDCFYWSFKDAKKVCWLKSSSKSATSAYGAISGPKVCPEPGMINIRFSECYWSINIT